MEPNLQQSLVLFSAIEKTFSEHAKVLSLKENILRKKWPWDGFGGASAPQNMVRAQHFDGDFA